MSSNASIRGNVVEIHLFQNGGDVSLINVLSSDINQKSGFISSEYVGAKFPVGDQSIDGWEGNFSVEVSDANVDKFIDALVNNNLSGVGIAEYTFTETVTYPDGTISAYVYFDMQFKIGKKIPGRDKKVTYQIDFQAAGRQPL